MRRKGKERHPASKALITLRESLGMSQGDFAKSVAGMSEISIAKYETSHPPKGEQLTRLRDIAMAQSETAASADKARALHRVARQFQAVYLAEVLSKIGPALSEFVDAERAIDYGFLTMRLEGHDELAIGECTVTLVTWLRSMDPNKRRMAQEWIRSTEDKFPLESAVASEFSSTWNWDGPNGVSVSWLGEETRKGGKKWRHSGEAKPGGTSSNSAGSKSASRRTRKTARKR